MNVSKRLQNAQISPTGARALFEARGEIVTVPAEKGDPRNLTNTPAVMERSPAWSPDGKWLAYAKQLSNSMGAIFAYSLAGAKSTQITDGMSDAKSPVWDKDGKYLYFTASTDSGPAMEQDLHSGIQRVRAAYIWRATVWTWSSRLGRFSGQKQ